jgi:DNA-binding NtrC family response regulator
MAKGNLLIVDDEPMILETLKFNLEDYADKIFTAENGLEALDVLDKQKIHCVVCDINMPKMNGVELIKAIRKNDNDIPFIFYTGHGNYDLMMEAVKYGAFDFLDKPNFDGLEDVISRGMKEGFDIKSGKTPDPDTYMSELKKLLDAQDNKDQKE